MSQPNAREKEESRAVEDAAISDTAENKGVIEGVSGTEAPKEPVDTAKCCEKPRNVPTLGAGAGGNMFLRRKVIPFFKLQPRKVPSDDIIALYRSPTSGYYFCTSCKTHFKHRNHFIEHIRYDCGNKFSCSCRFTTTERRHLLFHVQEEHGDNICEMFPKLAVLRIRPKKPMTPPKFLANAKRTRKFTIRNSLKEKTDAANATLHQIVEKSTNISKMLEDILQSVIEKNMAALQI